VTEVNNKTIVVTGATSGIGLALISQLQKAGYFPILTGRNDDKVTTLAASHNVPGYCLDVADAKAVTSVSAQIEADHGPVRGLINNAGIWLEGEFTDYSAQEIKAVIDTNMFGTIMMTHAILPAMQSRGRGAIINVVSTGALYTRKMISIYAASKWAIRGFTGCLEVECAPKGVRVMGFYPGKIESNMYEAAGIRRNLDMAMTPQQAAAMIITMLQDETMVWGQVSGRSIEDYV